MRQTYRLLTTSLLVTVALLTVGLAADNASPKSDPAKPDSPPAAPANAAPATEEPPLPLSDAQEAINARYRRFEKTLLEMIRFLEKTDPDRAAILHRAYSRSQTEGVGLQMETLIKILRDDSQLGDAIERQGNVVDSLQVLLDLLMSDDREKELAKEKARIEQYLKDLNKIIAGQKDVRAATERGEPGKSLSPRQEKLTEKTEQLGTQIDSDDHSRTPLQPRAGDDKPNDSKPQDGQPGDQEDKPGENKPGEEQKPDPNKPPTDDPKSTDPKPTDPKPTDPKSVKPKSDKPQSENPKPDESKPGQEGDSQPSNPEDGKPSDSQSRPPQPGESKPGQPQPGESQSQPPQPPQKTAGRDELKKAKQAMEKAVQKLQKELQKDAAKNQDEALRELQQAKERLEEILRQLREEEELLKLVSMEARFQRMLAQQIAIYNETVQLDKVPQGERVSRHQLKSEELSLQESELVLDASKSLTLLQEEGTAVAFPEAIEQMRIDMHSVAGYLKQMNVGQLTQTIELDIIAGLKEMIDSLQASIDKAKEKEQKPMPQEGQQQQEQDEELLKKIAELKMLKSLQLRINNRTSKLGQLYPGEQATQPEIIRQIQELALRQSRIQKATYDLAAGKNK